MTATAYESEAAMCAAFMQWVAGSKGWTAYPETAGWDVLLAHTDGTQMGVQAKQQLNAHVLTQALESDYALLYDDAGPDYRAVLVPAAKARGFDKICDHLGITIIKADPLARPRHYEFRPALAKRRYLEERGWFDRCPTKRCRLPDYVPDVAAGAPAPLQLTDWKIRAIKIAVLLKRQGFVTRADFAVLKISIARWLTNAWLAYHPEKRGVFLAHRMPDFATQHPRNFAEIEADFEKWKPSAPALPAGSKAAPQSAAEVSE